jgi:hypothetical protein
MKIGYLQELWIRRTRLHGDHWVESLSDDRSDGVLANPGYQEVMQGGPVESLWIYGKRSC